MNNNTGFNLSKKPKSIKCYLCGFDFGTSSVEIHMRQCKTKIENEKGKKILMPPEYEDIFVRIKNKEKISSEEIDEFNDYANDLYKEATLIACKNCGRRFVKDRLDVHMNSCKTVNVESLKKFAKGGKPIINDKKESLASNDLFLQKLNNELNKEGLNTNPLKKSIDNSNNKQEIQFNYEKKIPTKENTSSPLKTKTNPSQISPNQSKPKTLQCYICGRDFGLTSLEIHIKTCEKTFYNEEFNKGKKLPSSFPQNLKIILNSVHNKIDVSHEDLAKYNDEANEIYKALNFEPCPNCSRKFPHDRLKVHLNGCKDKSGGTTVSSTKLLEEKLKAQLNDDQNNTKKKPQFLMCYVCGREFSRFSLEIHIKQCIEKFIVEEEKSGVTKVILPETPGELINILEKTFKGLEISNNDVSLYNEIANTLYREYSMKECKNCFRKFKAESLIVHLKSCNKGSGNQGSRFEGTKEPNMMSRPKMLMCPLCGREFGSLSLEIHMKTCKQKFEYEQSNLPKNQRKSADVIIEKFEQSQKALKSSGNYSVEKMNNDAYDIWSKESLMPCDICGRTFLPDRLLVHKRSCKPKK